MDLVDLRIDFVDLRVNFVDLETNFVDLDVGFMGLKMDSGDLVMDCGFGDGHSSSLMRDRKFNGKGKGSNKEHKLLQYLEIKSENNLLDEDEDVEEENDHESEVPEHTEPVGQKIEASPAPKEAERQLSKKEIRKKELVELEALLADYRVEQEEKGSSDLPSNSFASCIDGVSFYK
ncbi:hypothetical protein CQW23_19516 [Capsicum baccatum]|uniref:Uncharacterized protein n=1 Tax=Capsicum baccatum TaxID=33114 RepID=A0A2G2W610_CAPBA|nr:hypothetical protein CQW23_19516 [Capsicum baccatum]